MGEKKKKKTKIVFRYLKSAMWCVVQSDGINAATKGLHRKQEEGCQSAGEEIHYPTQYWQTPFDIRVVFCPNASTYIR